MNVSFRVRDDESRRKRRPAMNALEQRSAAAAIPAMRGGLLSSAGRGARVLSFRWRHADRRDVAHIRPACDSLKLSLPFRTEKAFIRFRKEFDLLSDKSGLNNRRPFTGERPPKRLTLDLQSYGLCSSAALVTA